MVSVRLAPEEEAALKAEAAASNETFGPRGPDLGDQSRPS